MKYGLLLPPIAFALCLGIFWLFSKLTESLAHPAKKADGKDQPYACGEDFAGAKAEPEYGFFFPFAVFFTILHVAGLMAATWATAQGGALFGAVYLAAIGLIIAVLFRG